jgi:hypothetical protein
MVRPAKRGKCFPFPIKRIGHLLGTGEARVDSDAFFRGDP